MPIPFHTHLQTHAHCDFIIKAFLVVRLECGHADVAECFSTDCFTFSEAHATCSSEHTEDLVLPLKRFRVETILVNPIEFTEFEPGIELEAIGGASAGSDAGLFEGSSSCTNGSSKGVTVTAFCMSLSTWKNVLVNLDRLIF